VIEEDEEGMLHGTRALKELISPWSHSDWVVCADSYFASVGAAEHLKLMGFWFIGVIKQATKRYPMAYLSAVQLHNQGDHHGLMVIKDADGQPNLFSFVRMDRDFIASGSSLAEGAPYKRHRWRQLEADADPARLELAVPQPKACEIYYQVCGKIDQHNRDGSDSIIIDKN
jgi:hypothetical protein